MLDAFRSLLIFFECLLDANIRFLLSIVDNLKIIGRFFFFFFGSVNKNWSLR